MKQSICKTTIKIELQKVLRITVFKSVMFLLLGMGLITTITAQNEIKKINYDELIYIEADPLAYINKGYSIHLGYENWGWRFDLTKVNVDFPESYEDAFYNTTAFDLITDIHGVKIDYIGNRSDWTKNAFVGLDVNYQRLNFTHKESNATKDLSAFNIGLRTGYKFPVYKGFYVTPWAAIWRNVNSIEEFTIGNDRIDTNEWDWILTLHFGYAIKF